jgi:hypothetical protein
MPISDQAASPARTGRPWAKRPPVRASQDRPRFERNRRVDAVIAALARVHGTSGHRHRVAR